MKGDEVPETEQDAWEWLRNPLPPAKEDALFAALRLGLGLPIRKFFTDRGFGSLGYLEQQAIGQSLEPGYLQQHNPIVRHTVLRRRQTLEEAGLMEKVAVDVHPDPEAPAMYYSGVGFNGLGLMTNHPFNLAYEAAEAYTAELKKRTNAAGFMKSLLLQRICSSFASGESTARKMLRQDFADEEDEEQPFLIAQTLQDTTAEKLSISTRSSRSLSRDEARDPKLAAIRYFLNEHRTEGRTWLEHGCIIFSQYFDTAYSVAKELAMVLRTNPSVCTRVRERAVSSVAMNSQASNEMP